MSNNIPNEILKDVTTFLSLVKGERSALTNDQGERAYFNIVRNQNHEPMLSFSNRNSLSYINGEFNNELFIQQLESFHVLYHRPMDDFYCLTTIIENDDLGLGCDECIGYAPNHFMSCYDFDTDKGLPESMYEAYAYLYTKFDLPMESRLEIFGAIITSLPVDEVGLLFDGKVKAASNAFDVIKAIEYDLKTQQPITA